MQNAAVSRPMVGRRTLRRITIAVLAAAFVLLVVTQYLVGRGQYLDGFWQAEQRDLLARARHAQAVLQQSATLLKATAADYGVWEESHNFMLGKYPRYAEDNWYPGTFERLDIDLTLFIDTQRQVVLAMRKPSSGVGSLTNSELIDATAPSLLKTALSGERVTGGYTLIGRQPYMWAAAPIKPRVASLPVAGHVMFFRQLDRPFTARYAKALSAEIDIGPSSDPAATAPAAHDPLDLGELRFAALDGDRIRVAFVLSRVANQSAIAVSLTTDRPLIAAVRLASNYFLWSSVAMGLLVTVLVMRFMEKRVLGPLGDLALRLHDIGARGNLTDRLPVAQQQDEIADVVTSINRMLTDLEAKQSAESARDAALEASRLKSEFLAVMSHEIRTPMNGVLGMLELLERSQLSTEQGQRVSTARRSAVTLLALLNDILDLSRLEAGRMTLEMTSTDISALLQEVCELLRVRAQEKGVALHLDIANKIAGSYETDGARVRQILLNVVGNAVKFTSSGEIRVKCAQTPTDDGRQHVTIAVTDTGIGIDDAARQAIFDPFVQEQASISRRYGGSGLGLSISQRLARLMGGEIAVDSTPGAGSTFTLHLTMKPSNNTVAVKPLTTAVKNLQLRVLVAEDNPINQEVAAAMLALIGCQVSLVANGEQAVQAFEQSPMAHDVILMDINMPQMDGYSATKAIRLLEKRLGLARRVPVIALTANAMASDEQRSEAAGMDQHLVKPFSIKDLQDALQRYRAA